MAPISSLPPPNKKRKMSKDSAIIQQLEQQLTTAAQANESLNPLADLVDYAVQATSAEDTSKAIYALYRVFVVIITSGKLGTSSNNESAKLVRTWIWEKLNAYVDFLTGLLKDEEKILRTSGLQILFSLQKHLSTSATKSVAASSSSTPQPQFHLAHFRKILHALLVCPPSARSESDALDDGKLHPDVLSSFLDTWFTVYDDIRWFFLKEWPSVLAANPAHEHISANCLHILEKLNTFPTESAELNSWWVTEFGEKPPKTKKAQALGQDSDSEEDEDEDEEEDDWRKFFDEPSQDETAKGKNKNKGPIGRVHKMSLHQSLHSLASHRAVFTRAWLSLLPRLNNASRSKGEKSLVTRALNVMHRGVMPHLTRPVLVMDWIGSCVDYGGAVGLLALNGLFELMTKYNLDYPSFYTRLYAFLDRNVLHLKYRARFFRLTELFLSSTHLPATLLASFVKRLARLSLSAPPAAIVMVIPFTYNILKKHPTLMPMIHREVDIVPGESYTDPFDMDEPNPTLTHALESSLWELHTHRTHYHTSVSTLAKIFEEAFTKPGYNMEDFLDHTYSTLIDTDVNRKIKKEPALGMDLELNQSTRPKVLFPMLSSSIENVDEEIAQPADIITELWQFG